MLRRWLARRKMRWAVQTVAKYRDLLKRSPRHLHIFLLHNNEARALGLLSAEVWMEQDAKTR